MPAVVHIYPRSTASCPNAYANGVIDFYEPELLARLGYVVLFPYAPEQRLRGSNGPLTNWSELVNPAVDAAVSAGYVDKERVGVFGLSFGAISTLELLAQNGRFRTAVASHGAANFTSHYGALSLVRRLLPSDYFAIGQSVGYESRGSYLSLQSTPWDEADLYVRSSPFFDVNKIHTPLLLMHSDLDPNFQMEQFDEVFTALFRLGRDVEYVRYWGEGHGLNSPANVRDMWVRLKNWYEKYLDPETMESAGNGSN
jgi:dipeptidyl aminopeptidase/acylaminoacyl peptidase